MKIEEWKLKNQFPRKYTHFDYRVPLRKVWHYVNNPKKVITHGFYPFIHFTTISKKYSESDGVKTKEREIYYSAHIDRYIYSLYGYKLNQFYNERTIKDGINESSVAYRDNLKKNNIHFAKQAFYFIKDTRSCFIIIGDFTNFFDCLDHPYLKTQLCNLLEVQRLPKDYYAIFKNITKYSRWELDDLLEINGLSNKSNGVSEFNALSCALPIHKFKELKKKHIHINKNDYGIPQGSPISAVLSNIYMLSFDKTINDYVTRNNGLYMRYSDDFIIILPQTSPDELKLQFNHISSTISSIPNLVLQPDKTKVLKYKTDKIISCNEDFLKGVPNGTNLINYLGFTFDGKDVFIRDKTVTKYYYRMYRKLKTIVKRKGRTKLGNRITCSNLYEKYSIKGACKGKGNFITYVMRAEKIFDEEQGVKQVRKAHMQKIRKKLKEI